MSIEINPQAVPLAEYNVVTSQPGDVIALPSVGSIDIATKFLGHQLMVVCGSTEDFNPESSAYPGNKVKHAEGKGFKPLSEVTLGTVDESTLSNSRIFVIGAVEGWSAQNDYSSVSGELRRAMTRLALAVDVTPERNEPYTILKRFELDASRSRVDIDKSHIVERSTSDRHLARRISSMRGSFGSEYNSRPAPRVGEYITTVVLPASAAQLAVVEPRQFALAFGA